MILKYLKEFLPSFISSPLRRSILKELLFYGFKLSLQENFHNLYLKEANQTLLQLFMALFKLRLYVYVNEGILDMLGIIIFMNLKFSWAECRNPCK